MLAAAIGESWFTVALTALNVFQFVALAWIAAWQQRAAGEVRKLNGQVAGEVRALAQRTSSGGIEPAARWGFELGDVDPPKRDLD